MRCWLDFWRFQTWVDQDVGSITEIQGIVAVRQVYKLEHGSSRKEITSANGQLIRLDRPIVSNQMKTLQDSGFNKWCITFINESGLYLEWHTGRVVSGALR